MTRVEGIEKVEKLNAEHHLLLATGMDNVCKAINANDIEEVKRIVEEVQRKTFIIKAEGEAIIKEVDENER